MVKKAEKKIEKKAEKESSGKSGDLKAKKKMPVLEVKASVRYLRISPRKVRLVVDLIRGKDIKEALHILKFTNKGAVRPVTKLLNSAIANAVNNFELEKNGLYVKKITANEGPTLKRWMPRAHGRATTLRKRTSHIDLILGTSGAPAKSKKSAVKPKEEVKLVSPDEIKRHSSRQESAENQGSLKGFKGVKKGIFNRKTG